MRGRAVCERSHHSVYGTGSETMSDDDWFSPEESAALVRIIFPDYPGTRNPNPVPDLAEFLRAFRAKEAETRK